MDAIVNIFAIAAYFVGLSVLSKPKSLQEMLLVPAIMAAGAGYFSVFATGVIAGNEIFLEKRYQTELTGVLSMIPYFLELIALTVVFSFLVAKFAPRIHRHFYQEEWL